ncbi:UDP-glucose/GDP-mannose dehydrogenase family protein [Paenibacillus sp. N3.4]|uniref:UDP-glucose dehydrogenase family protein n=1 Tax=Paenibacillus sp. N3.4 TaxID=2603222 RepID=UPI0011C97BD4|nr:UDP-glucose/GDP-mannose dehydrogenase family protein [Paenibacillus sp. N3.4]TXK85701.1 UDP-glucose/GDP-mannose dehydrogenase family protein [Paenibacillus sp. N3.4]
MVKVQRIAVIGTGYVGLVSGACLAEMGHQVVCVDRDERRIARLLQADIPIYEPGLRDLVASNLHGHRLTFTSQIGDAIRLSDIIVIAVGTPTLENGDVDMTQVNSVVASIAAYAISSKTVVMKSTVPVGTGRWLEEQLGLLLPSDIKIPVVSNPEFLREGSAIHDTFHPDRVVIGAEYAQAGAEIAELHAPLGAEILLTDRESAELIKYASNAFLAAKISFINEMAHVCEKVGANVGLVAKGMGLDRRIGPHFLNAGIGYGGSCFPKDTKAQLKIAQNVDYDFKILRAVIEVNHRQRERFVSKIERTLGSLDGKHLAVMGLAFKPNTDDLRDAPALEIIASLQNLGASVSGYDPAVSAHAVQMLLGVNLFTDPYSALRDADAMVIATEWDSLRELNWALVRSLLKQPIIIDGRNMFEPEEMGRLGFTYVSIGRKTCARDMAATSSYMTKKLFQG